MQTLGSNISKTNKPKVSSNPFAKALAETEKYSSESTRPQGTNPFNETLVNAGSGINSPFSKSEMFAKQQEEYEKQAKKEALRKKLHDQINPVDAKDIFDAREKQVLKEIDELRKELKLLAKDVSGFNKDIELTLMTPVSHPGEEGKYYINFFQQLRSLIIMLREKINSARTWSRQFAAKKGKKRRAGLDFSGKNEAKSVFDAMHHERSNAYGGG